MKKLTPFLKKHGLSWDGLGPFLALRNELCEIDVRFGQLGKKGIFAALDRADALTHRVPGVDNIEHAMENPPISGRARIRGECVRQLAAEPTRFLCDWRGVLDTKQGRRLDLSDDPKPAHIDEIARGIRDEGWKCPPYGGPVEALRGSRDPARMREICQAVPPSYARLELG